LHSEGRYTITAWYGDPSPSLQWVC